MCPRSLAQHLVPLSGDNLSQLLAPRPLIPTNHIRRPVTQGISQQIGVEMRIVLDSGIPLRMSGKSDLTIADDADCRVMAKGAYAKNSHRIFSAATFRLRSLDTLIAVQPSLSSHGGF